MPDMIRIEGARKIGLVAKALRHLGTDRTIINEMSKRIRAGAPDLRAAIKASAVDNLPRRGGLNRWVSRASIRVSVTRGDRRAGVRLIVGKNSAHGRTDIKSIDAGRTRHPLWGNRKHWYPTTVKPGFATNVMTGPAADQFRAHTLDSIDAAVTEVLRGL